MIFRLPAISILFLALSVLSFQPDGCRTNKVNKETVTKIRYSTTGGRGGNYESLEIFPDSLIYIQARRGVEKTTKEPTTKTFWDQITAKINLKDFASIKSNPGHALYDGIDITIAIETTNGNLSIVNGNEDTVNYNKIQAFTNLLENKLVELRPKITW